MGRTTRPSEPIDQPQVADSGIPPRATDPTDSRAIAHFPISTKTGFPETTIRVYRRVAHGGEPACWLAPYVHPASSNVIAPCASTPVSHDPGPRVPVPPGRAPKKLVDKAMARRYDDFVRRPPDAPLVRLDVPLSTIVHDQSWTIVDWWTPNRFNAVDTLFRPPPPPVLLYRGKTRFSYEKSRPFFIVDCWTGGQHQRYQ